MYPWRASAFQSRPLLQSELSRHARVHSNCPLCLLGCKGRVIGDRYHARALGTPREVRNALRYVLLNFRRHGRTGAFDRASSGAVFDGWSHGDPRACLGDELVDAIEPSVAPATRWLSTVGWRIHGRIDPSARPGPAPD